MKRLLLAGVALVAAAAGPADAADLKPIYNTLPMPPPAYIFSWSGCYVGAQVGAGWGHDDISDDTTPGPIFLIGGLTGVPHSLAVDSSGLLAGGQIGCNARLAQHWVIGVEAEISGADIRGNARDPLYAPFAETLAARTDWLASVSGRLGWAFDRWMVYGKLGTAWADEAHKLSGNLLCGPAAPCAFDDQATRTGGMVGVGLEWAFARKWSAKLEYDLYAFGRDDMLACGNAATCGALGPFTGPVHIAQDISTVKLGVNYRIGWGGPLAASY